MTLADAAGPGLVLTDEWGLPLVVSLSSSHAMNPHLVGDRVALLATAKGLGLPVTDGLVVTYAGFGSTAALSRLERARPHIWGPVRISLTDRGLRQELGGGFWHGDARSWDALVEGLDAVMARDRSENPRRQGRELGLLIQRVPRSSRSTVLDADWDRTPILRAVSEDIASLRMTYNRLRQLAQRTMSRLVRPVMLEVLTEHGGGHVIADLRELGREMHRTPQ